MNTILWIAQGMLAAMFLMVGMMKIRKSKEEMSKKMGWVEDFSQRQINMIGMVEILAVTGLILPMALNVVPILTPIAAIGLVVVMLGAMATHIKRKENKMLMMNMMLLVLAGFVAYGRLAL